jgi:hypothetical protein
LRASREWDKENDGRREDRYYVTKTGCEYRSLHESILPVPDDLSRAFRDRRRG